MIPGDTVSMKRYRAVLFDFDGTLAQTMEQHFNAWRTIFLRHNVEITPEEMLPLEGMALPEIARCLAKLKEIEVDALSIVQDKEAYYLANHSFQLYAGVETLLQELKQRLVPIAIVTAAPAQRFEHSVPNEFLALFDAVITGDKYERGKPFPDPYLIAATTMGVSANECLVVENAPMGVKAAKAAGAFCIGITSTLAAHHLKEADIVIGTFLELETLPVIKSLTNS